MLKILRHIILLIAALAVAAPAFASESEAEGEGICACVPSVGLRTNLLYDAAMFPNIGVEVPLGRRVSLLADWGYAWWSNDPRHFYWRIYGGGIEARYYLGRRENRSRYDGHHIGLYGNAATYDFEFGNRGHQSATWNFGGGISYGYTLPLSRRLSMDFTIGIGYFGGKYYSYEPDGGKYVWLATKNLNYVGITKLEISLVWLIGSKNLNR